MADDPAKLRNTCLVFDAAGRRVARYDKIHLFGFRKGDERYDEAATIEAGDQPVAFDYAVRAASAWRSATTCAFPSCSAPWAQVDLLVLPAAFTETTGRAHWELLLRARAIENQCYVLAAAQGGRHPNGRMTHGNSMIVDPWGEVLARMDKGEGVVVAELDPRAALPKSRSQPAGAETPQTVNCRTSAS